MGKREDRQINGRIGAYESWSRTDDPEARTKPARDKFLERFEREVDPDGVLPEQERKRRAVLARRAYMLRLAAKSAAARRQRKGENPDADRPQESDDTATISEHVRGYRDGQGPAGN